MPSWLYLHKSGGKQMEYVKDEMVFEREFPYRMFLSNSRQMYLHSHDLLEINHVKEGSGYYLIEEKEYEIHPGDIFIINNQERHMAVHDGSLVLEVIVFDPLFCGSRGGDTSFWSLFSTEAHPLPTVSEKTRRGMRV